MKNSWRRQENMEDGFLKEEEDSFSAFLTDMVYFR